MTTKRSDFGSLSDRTVGAPNVASDRTLPVVFTCGCAVTSAKFRGCCLPGGMVPTDGGAESSR